MNQEELQQRLQRLQSFQQADSGNVQILLDIGHLHMQLQQFNEALSAFEQAFELQQEPAIDFFKANALMALQQYEKARNILQHLLDAGIDNAGVRYNLGYCQLFLQQADNAVETFQAMTDEQRQQAPDTDKMLARSLHFTGKLEQASTLLENYLQHNPDDNIANGMLALLYIDQSNNIQALKAAEATLEQNSNNTDALLTMGLLQSNDFNLAKATEYFDRVLTNNPNSGRAWMGKGMASMADMQLEQAETELNKAIQLIPGHLGCRNTLAWAQIAQNKLEEAEATVKQALEVDRTFGDSYGTLATAQWMQGNKEEALHNQKLGKRLDPDSFACAFVDYLQHQDAGEILEAQSLIQNTFNKPITTEGDETITLAEGMQLLAKHQRKPDLPKE